MISSTAHTPDSPSLSIDPTGLTAHLGQCAAARGRLHRLRGGLAAVDALVQPRFLSALLLVLAAAGLLLLTAAA